MQSDEQQIRQLVATWANATKAGDLESVLNLMAEDVVFLRPGHAPMVGRSSFAAATQPQPGHALPSIDATQDIQEIQVCGDWAFLWTELSVEITPAGGKPPMKRAGHTLSIFRKQDGKWLLARDANMLAPV